MFIQRKFIQSADSLLGSIKSIDANNEYSASHSLKIRALNFAKQIIDLDISVWNEQETDHNQPFELVEEIINQIQEGYLDFHPKFYEYWLFVHKKLSPVAINKDTLPIIKRALEEIEKQDNPQEFITELCKEIIEAFNLVLREQRITFDIERTNLIGFYFTIFNMPKEYNEKHLVNFLGQVFYFIDGVDKQKELIKIIEKCFSKKYKKLIMEYSLGNPAYKHYLDWANAKGLLGNNSNGIF
jgi:hypothetical protein